MIFLLCKKNQSWIDTGYYKGASIIIIKNNQPIYEKHFGSYDTNTVAFIASADNGWLLQPLDINRERYVVYWKIKINSKQNK